MGWEGQSKGRHCEENGYCNLCSWVCILSGKEKTWKLTKLPIYPWNYIDKATI